VERLRLGKQKSNNKNLLIAVAVLAVIVIIVFIIRLFMTEPAEALYLRAEKNSFEKTVKWVEENYSAFLDKQSPYLQETHRRRVEITAQIEPDGQAFGITDMSMLSDLIEKSKLVVDMRKQPVENNSLTNVSLLLEKMPFLDAELFTDRQRLYLSVPVLLPGKYFSAELDRLEEVYDKFSISIQPKKLVTGATIAETLEFDAAAFRTSAGKLGRAAEKYFTKDTVKYGQEKELLISGETVKGREVLVTLSEESATALLQELSGLIVQEDALLQFTYGNIARLSSLSEEAGLFSMFEYLDETGAAAMNELERNLLEGLKVEKNLVVFKNALKETLSGYRVKDGLQMTAVIDEDGNILDRKLVLDLQDTKGNGGFVLDVSSGCSNTVFEDARNRFADIIVSDASRSIELHIRPDFKKAEGNETRGSIAFECAITPQGSDRTGMRLDIEISSKPDELTLKTNRNIDFKVKFFGDTGEGAIEGEWSNAVWQNKKLKSRNSTSQVRFKADLPFLGIHSFSGILKLAGEDRFAIEPFTLPDVRQSSIMDLNAATQKDLDSVEMEIMASFGVFYLNNKQIFDAFLGQ
jgi:hypothetical protein